MIWHVYSNLWALQKLHIILEKALSKLDVFCCSYMELLLFFVSILSKIMALWSSILYLQLQLDLAWEGLCPNVVIVKLCEWKSDSQYFARPWIVNIKNTFFSKVYFKYVFCTWFHNKIYGYIGLYLVTVNKLSWCHEVFPNFAKVLTKLLRMYGKY